ncbi:RNA polymerase sigma factor [Chitinophaga solisilvae]|uniref:RNA polymerase sigma factor n=1 Tax=Chitinophaga solisilvae TaxID=1233460 RepID=UPI00136E10EB|nr:sigma-70 family RNA polymerase sigma factor [Chitinophaga solisilvae]
MSTNQPWNIEDLFSAPGTIQAADAYKHYYKQLYNYGRKLTDNTSLIEDAIHDVFISVWQANVRNPELAAGKSYLFSSFRRRLFRYHQDAVKRIQREQQVQATQTPEFGADHFIIREEQDHRMKAAVLTALQQLTPRQREAVFLRFYENMQYDEIAAVLDISVKATYKLMARALDELKQLVSIPLYMLLPLLRLLFTR